MYRRMAVSFATLIMAALRNQTGVTLNIATFIMATLRSGCYGNVNRTPNGTTPERVCGAGVRAAGGAGNSGLRRSPVDGADVHPLRDVG